MDDLVQWLRVQLDDDERVALAIPTREWAEDSAWLADMLDPLPSQRRDRPSGWQPTITVDDVRHIALHDPARVLREVEATRRIIDAFVQADEQGQHPRGEVFGYHATGLLIALKHFAAAYSDRSGYREEWRP